MGVLEDCLREDLNERAPRRIAILDPLKVVIDNYPENSEEESLAPNHPQKPDWGKRVVPLSKIIYIEAGDFMELTSPADVEITWLARGASIGRSRPHGELLQDAVRRAVPVPGWVGIKAADGGAGPEPEDVNVDVDILWETPARMETSEIQASKNPGMPAGAMPFYAWIAGEAAVIKDMRRYLVRDVGIDRKQVAFMGYWRQGKAEG